MTYSLYIDAGSGTVVFQMLIGTLLGSLYALKLYWHKIKQKLSKNNDV